MSTARTRARRPLAALLLVPPIELVLLIVLAQHLGALPILTMVAASALIGVVVIRRASPRAGATLRELTGRGPTPEHHLSRDGRSSGRIIPASSTTAAPGGIAENLQAVGTDLTEDLLLLLAGIMLAWPGLITTLTGLILLVPGIRRRLATRATRRAAAATSARVDRIMDQGRDQLRSTVIHGETVDHADFTSDDPSHLNRRQIS